MLRINQQRSAHGAKSYFSEGLAREDYYTRDEIIGRWGGLGADQLGLHGAVTPEAFHALCDNQNPISGRKLTCRTRENRSVGYDFNFHAPKSLSLLYTLTGDRRLLDAFQESVRQTMQELETEVKTRVRKGGANEERVTGSLVYGEFVHLTARPVGGVSDPHLHAHCFVFNATHDPVENKWKAAQFRDLMRDAPYYEAAFHARLSRSVAKLGFGVRRTRNGWEVAGFARATLEKYSRRTAQIEEVVRRKGITSVEEKARLGAKTREKKGEARSLNDLQTEWKSRLTDGERHTFAQVAAGRVPPAERPATVKETVAHALRHGFERASVVSEKRLWATALKRGYGSVRVEEVKQSFAAEAELIRRRTGEQTFVTTKEVLAEEGAVIAFGRDGRGTCKPLARGDVEIQDSHLNREQQAAVRHVLTCADRVMLIRGAAGTGKTTLLRAAATELNRRGKEIHVFAPTTEAARGVLRRDGFEQADTLARLLADKEMQKQVRGGVIWVDEAGLVGMRDMRQLFLVAKEQQARVILMGDDKQHAAVPRGTPFRLLQTHAGIKAAEVSDIQRQQGQYKAAVECLSRGDIREGFERLDRLGYIREVEEGRRHLRLAEDYLAAVREGKSALVVAPTHAEGRSVTAAVRSKLQEEGRLGDKERTFRQQVSFGFTEAMKADPTNYRAGDIVQFQQNAGGKFRKGGRWEVAGHDERGQVLVKQGRGKPVLLPAAAAKHFEVYEKRELRLAVGDRIRITQNGMAEGGKHRLINGSIHTVEGFDHRGNIVIDNKQVVPKDYGNLAHGYCTTSHSSQGKTVDRVLVAMGEESFPAASQQQFYVSASRGREALTVYCTDKRELLQAAMRSDERTSATELVQSRPESLARGRLRVWRNGELMRRREVRVERERDSRDLPQKEQKRRRELER
jgi:conjugative relaxase-like TrwC/TraI family protein